jgi:hypothetical protein
MQTEGVPPEFTLHALQQAQLRGIPIHIVQTIYATADRSVFVGSGCQSLMVSRKHLEHLREVVAPSDLERMDGVVLVVDRERRVIITIFHSYGQKGQRYRRQWKGNRIDARDGVRIGICGVGRPAS